MPTLRRLFILLAVLGTALLAAPARAADVPRLTGSITDQTGTLAGSTGEIQAALDGVLHDHGVQLFVLFTGTTGDLPVTDFATETARVNSLGVDDALLVVALGDRTDAIWVADGLREISDAEIDGIISSTLEPALRSGSYATAVIVTARALGEAAVPAPIASPSLSPTGQAATVGFPWAAVGAVVVLAVGGALLARWLLARRAAAATGRDQADRLARLAREANAALIAVDERIRSADDEAGFVEAQFGETEAAPFRAAAVEARAELRQAFAIRQRLDDAEPEEAPAQEMMLREILDRTAKAATALDRQAARIAELRNLEREAPQILAALPGQAAVQDARLPAAAATLAALSAYAEASWASVKGNVEEATKGLTGARLAIEEGSAALARDDRSAAGQKIRLAQEGIAGAKGLLDAIDHLAATTRELEARLAGQLSAAQEALGAARAAITAPSATAGPAVAAPAPPGTDRAAELAAAEAALRAAREAAAARPLDPIAAHHLATDADTKASNLLAALRGDAEQEARAAAALDAAIRAARETVGRAADFIATRRSGVGGEARTRLAEAQRLLERAEAARTTDPPTALEQANRAHQLAAQAYDLAVADFDRWDQGSRPSGPGSDIAGAVLGGIIGGILAGRGGGWGGSPWGTPSGPGGWGGGGWGGGRSHGGGFGSGSGGGGRARGGRW